jgi:hypothetical protein
VYENIVFPFVKFLSHKICLTKSYYTFCLNLQCSLLYIKKIVLCFVCLLCYPTLGILKFLALLIFFSVPRLIVTYSSGIVHSSDPESHTSDLEPDGGVLSCPIASPRLTTLSALCSYGVTCIRQCLAWAAALRSRPLRTLIESMW